MIFHVRTEVQLPADLDPEVRADLLQRDHDHLAAHGIPVHRAVGRALDFSLIDAPDAATAHDLVGGRPVARYARVEITAVRSARTPG